MNHEARIFIILSDIRTAANKPLCMVEPTLADIVEAEERIRNGADHLRQYLRIALRAEEDTDGTSTIGEDAPDTLRTPEIFTR